MKKYIDLKNNLVINDNQGDNILLVDNKEYILKQFRGLNKEVLKIIFEIKRDIFSLQEIYKYKKIFKEIFPNSHTIQESIRKTLQILRDKGILNFVDNNGQYKLLIK
ncbi:hypothetical protein [Spiroplasma mirum]|nr:MULTISPECIES: hypothetical protein [Spiroplasma]AHF61282.1 hypothetical protein SMM_0892 [Spiroplasma mirum ATCC 29335]